MSNQDIFEQWFKDVASKVVMADTIKAPNGEYYFAETRLLWQCWLASSEAKDD